ncbi:MFS transporter [Fodinicurvata halophila]|uniref:MFS transporter n=1 Tax=Fodinicurvata halophila TaxID=1419723 RepID=UPI003638917F
MTTLSAPAFPFSGFRNVLLLAICQAIYLSCAIVGLTMTGLAGSEMAPSPALSTVPFTLLTVGTALSTIPASYLMKVWGRRPGFVLGNLAGALGGGLSAWAILQGNFLLFCFANLFLGTFQATALYYRFAAAEVVAHKVRARAISYVMAGGVVASIIGPVISVWSRGLLAPVDYAGSFLALMVLALGGSVIAALVRVPPQQDSGVEGSGRPLLAILKQPRAFVAIANSVAAYSVMVFIMTATPLAAVHHDHGVDAAGWIIQAHVFGMFAPALITGSLITRYGLFAVLLTGCLLLLVSAVVAISGLSLAHFWVSCCCWAWAGTSCLSAAPRC